MKNAIWLPGYQVLMEQPDGAVQHFRVSCATTVDACPKCGVIDRLYRHGTDDVTFRDIPSFGKQIEITVHIQRYRCRECGTTANQPLPGMDSRRRMTERCIEWITDRGITDTFSSVARHVGVDEKTVRNICIPAFQQRLAERGRDHGEYKLGTPFIIGIDELMLDGQMRAIFMDIGRSRILDITDGHRKWQVARWLSQLPDRSAVQIVAIDMAVPYRDVVRALLPQAAIVIDKFHVVRCANQALDQVRNRARRMATGAGRRNPWRGQRLLRRRADSLSEAQAFEVDGITANNPLVNDAYRSKEAFMAIWKAADRTEAERLFDQWRHAIPEPVSREFGKVANMVERWRKEVFAYFDCGITNAVTENRNSLIKTLYRSGRGYTFDVIRAKALLAPPLPNTTKECPMCKQHAITRTFGEARAVLKNEYTGEPAIDLTHDICGSCLHVFNNLYRPFMENWNASVERGFT
jgi:transposase